jgi:hypothetical protein
MYRPFDNECEPKSVTSPEQLLVPAAGKKQCRHDAEQINTLTWEPFGRMKRELEPSITRRADRYHASAPFLPRFSALCVDCLVVSIEKDGADQLLKRRGFDRLGRPCAVRVIHRLFRRQSTGKGNWSEAGLPAPWYTNKQQTATLIVPAAFPFLVLFFISFNSLFIRSGTAVKDHNYARYIKIVTRYTLPNPASTLNLVPPVHSVELYFST